MRTIGALVIWAAAALILGAWILGVVRVGVGRTQFFKSSGVVRPLAAIVVAAVLMRRSAVAATLIVALTVAWWMPVSVYEATIRQLTVEKHPLRDVSECVRQVQATPGSQTPPGLYVDTDSSMWHPIYYYFRRLRPWTHQTAPAPDLLDRNLHDPASLRPSLVQEERYREYLRGPEAARFTGGPSPPMVSLFEYVLLLPGPYSVCSSEAALQLSR
jgi:hypothetical protein